MKVLMALVTVMFLLGLSACAKEKPKPRYPLPLGPSVSQAAQTLNNAGIMAYQSGQYTDAKSQFEQTVAKAPDSGEAHYNLGLVLYTLGDTESARDHFIEAANLAPGNQVIWDSPALRPFGSPDSNIPKKTKELGPSTRRPTFGGMGPRQ